MTKLTKEMRQNILHKIMSDVPNVDYAVQIVELVQKTIIEAAPDVVKAMYADPELKGYLSRAYLIVRLGNRSVLVKIDRDIVARLERLTKAAENSTYKWGDGTRLMPAAGVADLIYEAMDAIVDLRVELQMVREDAQEAEKLVDELLDRKK